MNSTNRENADLPRTIGLWSAVAILVGSVIGSGIFRSPAAIADRVPDATAMMLVWVAGGALIGAAFYRDGALGGLMIAVGIVAAGLTGWVLGSAQGWGPGQLLYRLLDADAPPVLLSVLAVLGIVAGLLALTWRLARDIPLKNKTA